MSDFKTFLETTRRAAASAFVRGDASEVIALSADRGPATFFDPSGKLTQGATAINAANEKGAAQFGAGSTTELELIDEAAAGDLAFWTGYQRADVEIDGKTQHLTLRITEVYRRVDGAWKMIHRHASKAAE